MLTRSATSDLQVMGTPSYMSPEQTKGLKADPANGFLFPGCGFFRTPGRQDGPSWDEPFMNSWRISGTPLLPRYYRSTPKLPAGLDRIIQRALEKEPAIRYRDGKEFAKDIEQVLKGRSLPTRDIKATRKADLLKPIDFFHSFSRKEIEEITRYGTFIRYEKSQVIVREGDVDTTFFILLYGKVRVIKNNRKIADLPKGACFGEMGAINKTPRTAHVIAREPCLVLKLDLKVMERESPDLKVNVLSGLH